MKYLVLITSLLLGLCSPSSAQFNGCQAGFCAAKKAASTGCTDTNVVAWEAAVVTAGGTVSPTQDTRVCTLVGSLKAHGSWITLERLWLYASENLHQANIDIVTLAVHTVNGSPTFTTNRGYQQASPSDYIDTGFDISTGVKYLQNSASISAYITSSRTSSVNFTAYGISNNADTGNQSTLHPLLFGNLLWSANNDGNNFDSVTNPTGDAQGFYTVNRSAASGTGADDIYKNSVTTPIGTGITASVTRPALNMFVLGQNLNGVNNPPTSVGDQLGMFSIGGSLGNGTAIAQFQTDVNTYMTSIGANVY